MLYRYIDIETLDLSSDPHIKGLARDAQLEAIRFGCAVTYRMDTKSWQEWRAEDIINLYEFACRSDLPLVGWNINAFDWPIIFSSTERTGYPMLLVDYAMVYLVDLFFMIRQSTGRWYKLEDVVQANLGGGKLADGQLAAEWLRSDDPALQAKAMAYCRHDVQMTADLHAILLRGEPLRLPPRAQRKELNELLYWYNGRVERIPDANGAISKR